MAALQTGDLRPAGVAGRKPSADLHKMAALTAQAMGQEITLDDLRKAFRTLAKLAIGGDIGALRLFFDRCGGPAQPFSLIDEVATIRQELEQRKAANNGTL